MSTNKSATCYGCCSEERLSVNLSGLAEEYAAMNPHSSVTPRDPHVLTCSTCGTRFLLDESPVPPFCSERCQLIDLGHWLDEEIGVPHEGDPGDVPVEYRDEPDDVPDAAGGNRRSADD